MRLPVLCLLSEVPLVDGSFSVLRLSLTRHLTTSDVEFLATLAGVDPHVHYILL